jgi:hypothetical protein
VHDCPFVCATSIPSKTGKTTDKPNAAGVCEPERCGVSWLEGTINAAVKWGLIRIVLRGSWAEVKAHVFDVAGLVEAGGTCGELFDMGF